MTEAPSMPLPAVLPSAHPLDEFYVHAGLALPPIEMIPAAAVPAPYDRLLVHDGDMTSALEKHYGSAIHLEVLRRETRGDTYFREVVLVTDEGSVRTEFGAIKINLALFPRAARLEILAERLPLGAVLAKFRIPYLSRPKAFLKIQSDDFINRALHLRESRALYGRRNTLSNPGQHPLAEVLEILAPAENGV